ncbi:MAG: C4-dicarboxylate ABC transporter, partial [Azoarcus sp.]
VTGKRIEPVKTTQIYRGSIPFVLIQIFVLALIIIFPQLVTGNLDAAVKVDLRTIEIEAPTSDGGWGEPADSPGGW